MVVFQDAQGLVFYPACQIASLTPTFPGRWRVVACDGTVGYCWGLPEGPWVRLGESRVAPQFLTLEGMDAGGWGHGACALEPVTFEPAAGDESIWAWRKGEWLTDQGPVAADLSEEEVLRLHPDMRLARRGFCFNVRRLRRLLRAPGSDVVLVFDNGERQRVRFEGLDVLRSALGLEDLFCLGNPALWTYGLRDFPFELNACDGDRLRALFPDLRELIGNFLWQAIAYRRQGLDLEYGSQIRGYWYFPLCPAVFRAGFVTRRDKEQARLIYEEMLGKLIGEERLFDYSDLGFEEEEVHFRHYGSLPVVLMVEKKSLVKRVEVLLDLGVCALCTGGTPRLISSEYFAKGLLRVHSGPIVVIAYVDYDPGGWWAARTLVSQLRRFGVECELEPRYLVEPGRFTPEELGLYAMPLDEDDPRADGWFAETGGIGGERRVIYANSLRPAERVRAALVEMLGQCNL